MLFSKEISTLKEQIAGFLAKLTEAIGQKVEDVAEGITQLIAQRDQARTDLSAANEKATGLQGQIDALAGEKADLTKNLEKANGEITDLKADFDKKVDAKVLEMCTAAGVEPIKRDAKGASQGSTREELIAQREQIKDPSERARFNAAHFEELTSK